ncbi:MAG: hypothetical protein ACFCVF_12150 [Kineosporiaceae bacterium]
MAWAVTLRLRDCATNASITGWISDGISTFATDSSGQFIAVIDDVYTGYIVSIGSSGYTSTNFHIDKAQHSGTIQTVCLNRTPSGGGGGSTGGGGGGW